MISKLFRMTYVFNPLVLKMIEALLQSISVGPSVIFFVVVAQSISGILHTAASTNLAHEL